MNIVPVSISTPIDSVVNVLVNLYDGPLLHQCSGLCYKCAVSKVRLQTFAAVKKMTEEQCRFLKHHVEIEDLPPRYIYLAKYAIERIGGIDSCSLLCRYILDRISECRNDTERFGVLCLVPNITKEEEGFIEHANPQEKQLLRMLQNGCDRKDEFVHILRIAVMYMDRDYCDRVILANRGLFIGVHREASVIDSFVRRVFAKRCEALSKVAISVNMDDFKSLSTHERVLPGIVTSVRSRWTSQIINEGSEPGSGRVGVRLVRKHISSETERCVQSIRSQISSLVSDDGTEGDSVPSGSTQNVRMFNSCDSKFRNFVESSHTEHGIVQACDSYLYSSSSGDIGYYEDGSVQEDANGSDSGNKQEHIAGSDDVNEEYVMSSNSYEQYIEEGNVPCSSLQATVDVKLVSCDLLHVSTESDVDPSVSAQDVIEYDLIPCALTQIDVHNQPETNLVIELVDGANDKQTGLNVTLLVESHLPNQPEYTDEQTVYIKDSIFSGGIVDVFEDVNICRGTKRKRVNTPVVQSVREKAIFPNTEYSRSYKNLLRKIESIALSFTDSEAQSVVCMLKQCLLSIRDLFVVMHVVHKHLERRKRITLAKQYLQSVILSCDTDREKKELLRWIPDSLKSSVRIGELLHGYKRSFLEKFYEGNLPMQELYRVINALSLCLSDAVLKKALSKYEKRMSIRDFQELVDVIDLAITQRKDSLGIVEEHIECTQWKEKFLCKQINVLPTNKFIKLPDCIKSKVICRKISRAKCNGGTRKRSREEQVSSTEYIRRMLCNGLLRKEEIVDARKQLLMSGVYPEKASRWFRCYKKKVLMSDKLSKKCKDDILHEIDLSYEKSRHLYKYEDRIPSEIYSIINRVKAAEVQLCDLRNIRSTLLAHLDSDSVCTLFKTLKRKLLKESPEKSKQIQLSFDASVVKRKTRKELSLEEKNLLSSFNSGNIRPDDLSDAVNNLLQLDKKRIPVATISKYIVAAIKNGVPGDEILANLPANLRHYGRIISAISQTDYEDILLLKNKTLSFDRLEEVSHTAVKYFGSSKLLGMLFNYLYSDRNISISKQESFFKLLKTMVCHGIIKIPFGIRSKECTAIGLEDSCNNSCKTTDGLSMMDAILQSPYGGSVDENMTISVFLDRMRDLCCESVDDNMQIDTTVSGCNIVSMPVDKYSTMSSSAFENDFVSNSQVGVASVDVSDMNAIIVGKGTLLEDMSNCRETRRNQANTCVVQSTRRKATRTNKEYSIAYTNLLQKIEAIALSFTTSEAHSVVYMLEQCSLSIRDLFVVTCVVNKHLHSNKTIMLVRQYLQSVVLSCDTDREKKELLLWIPDSLKSSVRVGELFHGYKSEFLKKFYEGNLSIQELYEVVNTLSLYLSDVVLKKALSKYEIRISIRDFQELVDVIDLVITQRKDDLCVVEEHIGCIHWKEKLLCSQMNDLPINGSISNTIDSNIEYVKPSDCIKSHIVSRETSTAKCNGKRGKSGVKQVSSTESIKERILNGSLQKEEIIEARKKLLIAGEYPSKVSRWFRVYKKKILMSDQLSEQCKDDIIYEIDLSYEKNKYLYKSEDRIPSEISDLIKRVQASQVQLCDLSNIRSTLISHVGGDRTYNLFLMLKDKLLKQNPGKSKEIQLAFDASVVKHSKQKNLSLGEEYFLSSFKNGDTKLDDLADSITKIFQLKHKRGAVSIICKYIVSAIQDGVSGDEILANLPSDVKHYGEIIRAFSKSDYEDILLLKNKTLPFDRLEEVSYTAVKYFGSSKLLNMLLSYIYSGKDLSIRKQESFVKLLKALVCHGIIKIPLGIKNKASSVIGLEDSCSNYCDTTDGLSMIDAILQSPYGGGVDESMPISVFLDRMRDLCCENVDDNMQLDTADMSAIIDSSVFEDGFGVDDFGSDSHVGVASVDMSDTNAVIVGVDNSLVDVSINNNDECLLDTVNILKLHDVELSHEDVCDLYSDMFSYGKFGE